MTTNMTNTIATIDAKSKVGKPNQKGIVTPTHAASETLLKSTKPNGIAIAIPTINPNSTAILLKNPVKYR